jgi:hypothetical protein
MSRQGTALEERPRAGGVDGNARLTGAAGAVIFVLLAIEGVTVPRVKQLLSAHVFIGMVLVPIVALKIGSTVYRFARYYRGAPDYSAKGPPPVLLRLVGPVAVASTVALFATGIAAIAAGPSSRWIVQMHKASFIVWFAAMSVHVLGHILETPALAIADFRRQHPKLGGTAMRRRLLSGALAAGVALGVLALGWVGRWQHVIRHG